MTTVRPDPGYGSALAPVGTVEWAKRWRLEFQHVVKGLPRAPQNNLRFYEIGKQHRAWTLVTDEQGNPYCDFDAFCRDRQPWGLGMDPAKFRAYLVAELGEKAADLVTVAPSQQGERKDVKEATSRHGGGKLQSTSPRKSERLRAILRTPEVVQELYREGLLTQTEAAKLGPKSPTPEQAAHLAEVRQRLEALDRAMPRLEFRNRVREILKRREASALQALRRAWARASEEEREAFVQDLSKLVVVQLF